MNHGTLRPGRRSELELRSPGGLKRLLPSHRALEIIAVEPSESLLTCSVLTYLSFLRSHCTQS